MENEIVVVVVVVIFFPFLLLLTSSTQWWWLFWDGLQFPNSLPTYLMLHTKEWTVFFVYLLSWCFHWTRHTQTEGDRKREREKESLCVFVSVSILLLLYNIFQFKIYEFYLKQRHCQKFFKKEINVKNKSSSFSRTFTVRTLFSSCSVPVHRCKTLSVSSNLYEYE